jgi:hypothetical protein
MLDSGHQRRENQAAAMASRRQITKRARQLTSDAARLKVAFGWRAGDRLGFRP